MADEVQFKVENEYSEILIGEFQESVENCSDNNHVTVERKSVPVEEYQTEEVKHEGTDFNVKIENIKTEIDDFYNKCDESLQECLQTDGNSNESHYDSVTMEYNGNDMQKQDDVNFKMEVEKSIKIEFDMYQEKFEESSDNQFTEPYGNIDGNQEPEEKQNRTVTNEVPKKYVCDICDFSTNYPYDLKAHMRYHKSGPTFQCGVCGKRHNSQNQLKYHTFTHLKEAKSITEINSSEVCETLGIKTRTLAEIKGKPYHVDIFKCRQCEYESSRISVLRDHICGVHLNEKNFKCEFCEFTSARKFDINVHIRRRHTFSKEFKCHECASEFYRNSELRNHIDVHHNNIKRFKCDHCNFSTHLKKSLKEHMTAIHLNKRRFECHFCDYRANLKSHLSNHLNGIHFKRKKFECNICQFVTHHRSSLDTHVRRKHHTVAQ